MPSDLSVYYSSVIVLVLLFFETFENEHKRLSENYRLSPEIMDEVSYTEIHRVLDAQSHYQYTDRSDVSHLSS